MKLVCLGGSLDKRQICVGLVCHITPAITGPAHSITLVVTGSPAHIIIPAVMGLVPIITPAAFTTFINYVYLRRIAVKDRFMVWLQFIFLLIDLWANGSVSWQFSVFDFVWYLHKKFFELSLLSSRPYSTFVTHCTIVLDTGIPDSGRTQFFIKDPYPYATRSHLSSLVRGSPESSLNQTL